MAKFLEKGMRGSAYTPPPGSGTVFVDVPLSYWAVDWIKKLYVDDITKGCLATALTRPRAPTAPLRDSPLPFLGEGSGVRALPLSPQTAILWIVSWRADLP